MTLRQVVLSVAVLAIGFMAGCETTQPKKTAATPPTQANAPTVTSPVTTAQAQPTPKTPENDSTKSDPADALIAAAERLAAGQANYAGGPPRGSKRDFDQAFNLLVSSNLDIHADDRLEQEFSKIVESVHDLELAALKQGDGFSEPQSEPAPIDEANDITFPVDPNVKAKAETEIKTTKSDLPLVLNDEVAMFINYFSSPRERARWSARWRAQGATAT